MLANYNKILPTLLFMLPRLEGVVQNLHFQVHSIQLNLPHWQSSLQHVVLIILQLTQMLAASKAVVLNRGYTYHLGVRGVKAGDTKHQSLHGYTLWKFKPDLIEHSS